MVSESDPLNQKLAQRCWFQAYQDSAGPPVNLSLSGLLLAWQTIISDARDNNDLFRSHCSSSSQKQDWKWTRRRRCRRHAALHHTECTDMTDQSRRKVWNSRTASKVHSVLKQCFAQSILLTQYDGTFSWYQANLSWNCHQDMSTEDFAKLCFVCLCVLVLGFDVNREVQSPFVWRL